MKKVVTVSLGASKQDFRFETDFLGQHFQVQRLGADDDIGKAWELMRRHQATAARHVHHNHRWRAGNVPADVPRNETCRRVKTAAGA